MHYLIIKFKKEVKKAEYDNLILFFKQLLGMNITVKEFLPNLIIEHDYDDLEMIEVIESLQSELVYDIVVFSSKKFTSIAELEEYQNFIYNVFNRSDNNFYDYFYDEKKFIMQVFKDFDYKLFKSFVLKKYLNDQVMIDILQTFFKNNLNTKKTSEELFMHRNTLINKIEKFNYDTGYDVRNFYDAYIIYNLIK